MLNLSIRILSLLIVKIYIKNVDINLIHSFLDLYFFQIRILGLKKTLELFISIFKILEIEEIEEDNVYNVNIFLDEMSLNSEQIIIIFILNNLDLINKTNIQDIKKIKNIIKLISYVYFLILYFFFYFLNSFSNQLNYYFFF